MRVSAERRLYLRVDLGIAVPPARRCEPTVPLPHQVKTLPPLTPEPCGIAVRYTVCCEEPSCRAFRVCVAKTPSAWRRHWCGLFVNKAERSCGRARSRRSSRRARRSRRRVGVTTRRQHGGDVCHVRERRRDRIVQRGEATRQVVQLGTLQGVDVKGG